MLLGFILFILFVREISNSLSVVLWNDCSVANADWQL